MILFSTIVLLVVVFLIFGEFRLHINNYRNNTYKVYVLSEYRKKLWNRIWGH